jgi:hypothetical protein
MALRTKRHRSSPTPLVALNQLIVARDRPDLYRALRRRVAACANVTIIFDRRQGERRHTAQSVPFDRRRGERRSARNPPNDLRRRGYIFARPQSRCPHD